LKRKAGAASTAPTLLAPSSPPSSSLRPCPPPPPSAPTSPGSSIPTIKNNLASPPATAAAALLQKKKKEKKQAPPKKQKTLSRRLNSVEAFFAWGAEVKGAFSIGLCVQLRSIKNKIHPLLLEVAVSEASLLDQPLARCLTTNADSFVPFRMPRVWLHLGAPAPEFVVVEREGDAHWERELERACNRPFRTEEVVLEAEGGEEGEGEGKRRKPKVVRGQRACSFVLLRGGDRNVDVEKGDVENDDNGTKHELVVRLHHALFDGKAAVAFVGDVLRRYEAKVAALEGEEELAAAVVVASAAVAAASSSDAALDGGGSDDGASTPPRAAPPTSALPSPALSSSPVTPLARWPSLTSARGGGGGGVASRSLSPVPRLGSSSSSSSSPSWSPPPPPPSNFFCTSLPPSSSALSRRLGPRAYFTRIVANVMLMHEGLALARKGLGLKLVAATEVGEGEGEEEEKEKKKEKSNDNAASLPPSLSPSPSPSSTPSSEERCSVSTSSLSVEETRALLCACRCQGSSANSALAAAALASAAAVGSVSRRSGGLSLQTHFDLRRQLRAAKSSSSSPVGLCSFSEIKWFPRGAFEDGKGKEGGDGDDCDDDRGGGKVAKLWEFARAYGRSVRAAGKVPEGAGLMERLLGPWRMAPPLTFRLQVRKGRGGFGFEKWRKKRDEKRKSEKAKNKKKLKKNFFQISSLSLLSRSSPTSSKRPPRQRSAARPSPASTWACPTWEGSTS